MDRSFNSLVEILQWRAINEPFRLAYRFLRDGENEESSISYGKLYHHVCAIAARLEMHTNLGDRVLIVLPDGLEFISTFFGCLSARRIAVPLPPPHPSRFDISLSYLKRIIKDVRPAAAIMSAPLAHQFSLLGIKSVDHPEMQILSIDEIELSNHKEQWEVRRINDNEPALIQYTSGSTTIPRGVRISHSNLMHNLKLIEQTFGQTRESRTVIWLPPYHDMGLIGGILQPMYTGNPVTIIPHLVFIQRPLRWLKVISRFGATTSGGPNFAYDLCVQRISPDQRDELDLSSWEVAFNGAEPVQAKTMRRFADYFASCGFRFDSFAPCYGLAEATLMVTGKENSESPIIRDWDKRELEAGRFRHPETKQSPVQQLVSCGSVTDDVNIKIVDPKSKELVGENQIGEIWISGPGVSEGYWNRDQESKDDFGSIKSERPGDTYFKTGDLGFLYGGELFIIGRLKEMIILNGKNFFPQDIERTIVDCRSEIRSGACAVFPVTREDIEHIVALVEIKPRDIFNLKDVRLAIQTAVNIHHKISLHDILITTPGTIPRTTSGKIRRLYCRERYQLGEIEQILKI